MNLLSVITETKMLHTGLDSYLWVSLSPSPCKHFPSAPDQMDFWVESKKYFSQFSSFYKYLAALKSLINHRYIYQDESWLISLVLW